MSNRPLLILLIVTLCSALASASLAAASDGAGQTTRPAVSDVTTTALRLLKQECFGCHNPEKHKGGLVLTSRDAAIRGNDSGPAVVAGRSADSRLVTSLAPDADPHMPPKKQLPAADVAALAAWVDAEAPWDVRALADAPATRPAAFGELPAGYAPVLALALSPDGRTLAVGRGRRVFLYDPARPDRPPAAVLDGPRDAVQSLAWSPDGKRLVAGDHGRALTWDAADPSRPPVELEGLDGRVTALLFLPDGDTLVAADGGAAAPARLHLFHLPDVKPQATVAAGTDAVLSIARTADGKLLATGGGDRVVRLWNPDLTPVAALEGHTGRVSAVAFSPDGALLASGSADRDLKVWDVAARDRKTSVGPHPSAVTAVAWAGPSTIAVAGEDGTVRLSPAESKDVARPLPAVADDVVYALAASADGKTLFAGCHDGRVYVFGPGGKLAARIGPPTTGPAGDR